jgi:CheY-like chemotaxis protein
MGAVVRVAGGLSQDVGDLVDHAAAAIRDALGGLASEDHARDPLERATRSLKRAALISRQLEALSRTNPHRPMAQALGRTVLELVPLSRRLAGPAITVMAEHVAPDAWISAGAGQLEQVLFHLVVNARDAMPDGGTLTMSVRTEHLDAPRVHRFGVLAGGPWVALEVHDTGCGMGDDVLARLFEPFFTTKAPGLGSGLGLATVYGIARQLGGQVVVSSAVGVGTTVALWLPACSAPVQAMPQPAGHAAVLVVDKDEWVRAVAARALRRAGYGVLEAADANAALNLLGDVAGRCVQVVVADSGITGVSGRSLAATLAERWPRVRVVVMTAEAPEHAPQAPSSPLLPLLRKPFSRLELLAAIAG